MFRCTFSVLRGIRPVLIPYYNISKNTLNEAKNLTSAVKRNYTITNVCAPKTSLIHNKQLLEVCHKIEPLSVRTVTKFSLNKGKRKTVKAALRRFFRLHWGGWIRTKVGRNKKIWKKSLAQRRRLRQHVFCNSTQSTLLDKMVTKFWKKPKYYVEDPYAPYHTREEFFITRRKPARD